MTICFEPAALGPVTLRNRVIKAATFEGRTPGGVPSPDLVEFHRTMAAGGVGMTTVAYCAVTPDGRTDRHAMVLTDEVVPTLRELTSAVHREGAAASAQLGHAGPVANAASNRARALAPSRFPNPFAMKMCEVPTADRLRELVAAHAQAALVAERAGFDAVEIHFGHNYLVSSFLSPLLNRRTDEYGGSVANRARLAREVALAVHDAVGGRLAVLAKLNMDDGIKRGLQPDEAVEIAALLEADGTLDALELTAGSSLLNPMYYFRGDPPRRSFASVMPPAMRWGLRAGGDRFLRRYDYEPLFLLETARLFRRELSMPLVLLGGITDRAAIDTALAEGFDFVAMGRALVCEPDLVGRLTIDAATPSLCTHCNECMPTVFSRTRCVVTPTFA